MTVLSPHLALDHFLLPKHRSQQSGGSGSPEANALSRCLTLLTYCRLLDDYISIKTHKLSESFPNNIPEGGFITLNAWIQFSRQASNDDNEYHGVARSIYGWFSEAEICALWSTVTTRIHSTVRMDSDRCGISLSQAMSRWRYYWLNETGETGGPLVNERVVLHITCLTPFIVVQGARNTTQMSEFASAYQLVAPVKGYSDTVAIPSSGIPIYGYENSAGTSDSQHSSLLTSPRGSNSTHKAMASPRARIPDNILKSKSTSRVPLLCGGSKPRPYRAHSSASCAAQSSYHKLLILLMMQALSRSYGWTSEFNLEEYATVQSSLTSKDAAKLAVFNHVMNPVSSIQWKAVRLFRLLYTFNEISLEDTLANSMDAIFWNTVPYEEDDLSMKSLQSFIVFNEDSLKVLPSPAFDLMTPQNSVMHGESTHPALIARLNLYRERMQMPPISEYPEPHAVSNLRGLPPWQMIYGLKKQHLDIERGQSTAFSDLMHLLQSQFPQYSSTMIPNIIIANCNDSTILINQPVNEVIITECMRCKVYITAAAGEVLVRGCTALNLVAAIHCVRVDNSYDIDLEVLSTSDPLITGGSRGCTLGSYSIITDDLASRLSLFDIEYTQSKLDRAMDGVVILSNVLSTRLTVLPDSPKYVMANGSSHEATSSDEIVIRSTRQYLPMRLASTTSNEFTEPIIPTEHQLMMVSLVEAKLRSLQVVAGSLYPEEKGAVLGEEACAKRVTKITSMVEAAFMEWLSDNDLYKKELHEAYNTAYVWCNSKTS